MLSNVLARDVNFVNMAPNQTLILTVIQLLSSAFAYEVGGAHLVPCAVELGRATERAGLISAGVTEALNAGLIAMKDSNADEAARGTADGAAA